mgnify:CR=1 FL=1
MSFVEKIFIIYCIILNKSDILFSVKYFIKRLENKQWIIEMKNLHTILYIILFL